MTGDNNNICTNLTASPTVMLVGLGPEQVNTLLLCDPSFAHLFGSLLPSSLHAAGAAAAGIVVPPVIASVAPLTAPPSIDNSRGSDGPATTVDSQKNVGGAPLVPPAAAPLQTKTQEDSDEIVIIEERPARTNQVVTRPPPVSSLRSDSPAAAAAAPAALLPPPLPPVPSSAAPAGAAPAVTAGGVGRDAQAMLFGGIAGFDLLAAGGAILLNDNLRLPATPDSPQNTSFSTATSSGVSSGASTATTALTAAVQMHTLKDALISNGEMLPKQEPMSREGSETGLDLNGRPPVPLCAICGADSTGIHFGVEACAACSAFFRRTVVLAKNYECTKGGECATNKESSSQRCRACRFKKCLTVGMDRNAVQHRRDAIGKVSQIKKEGSPAMDDDLSMMSGGQTTMSYHLMTPSTSYIPTVSPLTDWQIRHHSLLMRRRIFYTSSTLADAFDTRSDLESAPSEMRNFSECIYQLWRIEPRLVAEFVNSTAATVSIDRFEKAALFRNFFMAFQACEEPYLTWSFSGVAENKTWVMPNKMFFHFDHINEYFATNVMSGLNLDMATAVRIFVPSFHHAMQLVARPMADLGCTYLEMVALAGIVYLDPMAPGITSDTRVLLHKARGDLVASVLRYYQEDLFQRQSVPDSPEIRLAQLLNISAGIKIHAERTRENMQILSLFDVIPCDNMFNQMCNIEVAYSNEARAKLRQRAIEEELIPVEKIDRADAKWAEYKRQMASGVIPKGSPIHQMQGVKHEQMTAPVLERDVKAHEEQQLELFRSSHKKEEPEGSSTPEIAPGAVLAAAAAVAAVPPPRAAVVVSPPSVPSAVPLPPSLSVGLPLPPSISLASLFPTQPVIVSTAASSAAASAPAVAAALAAPPITTGPPTTVANMAMSAAHRQRQQGFVTGIRGSVNDDVRNIIGAQKKVEERVKMAEADRNRRYLFPGTEADQFINMAGFMQAVETNQRIQIERQQMERQQIERQNAANNAAIAAAIAEAQQAQQDAAAGASAAKRPRMADSATNTLAVQPQLSQENLLAALQLQQQLHQAQTQPMQIVMPVIIPQQLQQFQMQQQLQQLQQLVAMQPQVSLAQQQQLAATLQQMNAQPPHSQHNPF